MKSKFLQVRKMLLVAAGLLVGGVSSAWAEELQLKSIQSAYVDSSNGDVNYDGASTDVESLQINNTQYRDWNSGSDGSVKFNADGKLALYKFDLTELKNLEGTITAVTFTISGQTNDSGNKATSPVRILGYNPTWEASNITYNSGFTNNGDKETLTGTVSGKGSFQPLNTTDGLSINAGATTLTVNALTYVQSAIDANNEYVSFGIAVNLGRIAYLVKEATLTITYTKAATYDVTFSETNGVEAVVEMGGVDVTNGTKLADGSYEFTAKATGYEDYSGNFTISGANKNVEFTMTAKNIYSYTVYAKAGDIELKTLASGEYYAGDDVYYHYNQVLNYNGTLYEAASINSAYKTSFKLDENNKVVNHSYSQPATPVNNIIFLAEGEDIFTRGTGSSADSRCSMGAGGYASEKTAFVTLPAGTYKLVLSNRCSGERTDIHKFYKGDDEEPFFSANGFGYNQKWESGEFTLSAPTTLYMQGGDGNQYVDWLYVYCTGVSAIIGTTGYTTFTSTAALDLSGLAEQDVTAYYASEAKDGYVVLKEVTGTVAAGEGLILKGEGQVTIPVATSGEAIDGNLLKGCKAETTLTENANQYVLANNNGTAEFQSLADNGATIPAGKAYLEVSAAAARTLSIVFGGETTGIAEVATVGAENGAIYNLSGQRVSKPANGLYIVNGKKVVLK